MDVLGGQSPWLWVVGDRDDSIAAHAGIARSMELAGVGAEWRWLPTGEVTEGTLESAWGLWLAPGSPYLDLGGALKTCRWARERGIPFLGTCGGFQHAMVEIARNVVGISDATHAELEPGAAHCVIHRLSCGLVEVRGQVHLEPGSRLQRILGTDETEEGYHCRFGVDPAYQSQLESAGFRFSARDESGAIRGGELTGHPFFLGTLFQPERRALTGGLHPIVEAWISAARGLSSR